MDIIPDFLAPAPLEFSGQMVKGQDRAKEIDVEDILRIWKYYITQEWRLLSVASLHLLSLDGFILPSLSSKRLLSRFCLGIVRSSQGAAKVSTCV